MKKLIVSNKYNEKKLNNFILDSFPNLNKNTLYKTLRKKDIRINNIKVSSDAIIHTGDEITLYINDDLLLGKSNLKIPIIYEDNNIIIVNKPEELEVTENSSNLNLTSILKEQIKQTVYPCHRIDRNTKGLVLFAKNKISLDILTNKFKNREIEKHYLAKVYGIPAQKHDILEAYLFKDSKKSLVYISDIPKKNYTKIITEYNVLDVDKNNNSSLLEINLHTGKTHQIRAHLAHIGYPIIGDGKYGVNSINKKFGYKKQYLYSYSLQFNFKTDSNILTYLKGKKITLNIL